MGSRDFAGDVQYAGVPRRPSGATLENGERIEEVDRKIFMEFGEDIYDMVLIAAFGGVKMDLGHTADMKKPRVAVVHPAWIWLASACLFFLQITSIFCLRIDMDVNAHVKYGAKGEWHGRILLIMQIVMIIVLQVMIFKELLGCLRLLIFAINPTTWNDFKRASVQGRYSALRRVPFLAPFPVLALAFKFFIGYNICTDSLSVILVCRSVQDVIFNSLAITFIVDLDEPFWKMVSGIFHLDANAARDFTFELDKETLGGADFPEMLKCLHRRKGGREIENLISYMVLWIIYVRQLYIFLFALKTDVLPIARDVCSLFKYSHVRLLNYLLSKTVFADVLEGIDHIANDHLEHCTSTYKLTSLQDMNDLTMEQPLVTLSGLAIITGLVLGAQVARRVLSPNAKEESSALLPDTETEDVVPALVDAREFMDLKSEVAELRAIVAELKKSAKS